MRSQNRYLVSGLIVAALFAFALVGCSDDETTTPTAPPTTGSLDDAEFVVMQEQVNILADSVVTFFRHAINACAGLANEAIPVQYNVAPGSDDQYESVYSNGWHKIDWSLLSASGLTMIVDSIQFIKGSSPYTSPMGARSVTLVHNWYYAGELNSVTDTTDGRCYLTVSNLYGSPSTADGTVEHTCFNEYDVASTTVTRTYDFDVTLSDFELPQAASGEGTDAFDNYDSCPLEGTIEADVTMTYSVDGGTAATTTWEVEIQFTDGEAEVEVLSNNVVWTYDCTVCGI